MKYQPYDINKYNTVDLTILFYNYFNIVSKQKYYLIVTIYT